MCGIAGIYDLSGRPVSSGVVKAMLDSIAHRGPDGDGIYVEREVGLGHLRLAIIDLSPAAQQPMANEDASVITIYNGEIYNFRELRIELAASGHRFQSRTDSEL